MSIIDAGSAAEAMKMLDTIFELGAKRDAHDNGNATLSTSDYITYGQERADAALNFAQKFHIAYNDAQVTAWYQEQKV